jgi:hypothetical protein
MPTMQEARFAAAYGEVRPAHPRATAFR